MITVLHGGIWPKDYIITWSDCVICAWPIICWCKICQLGTFGWVIQGNSFVGSNQWLQEMEQIQAGKCFALFLRIYKNTTTTRFSNKKKKLNKSISFAADLWHGVGPETAGDFIMETFGSFSVMMYIWLFIHFFLINPMAVIHTFLFMKLGPLPP